MKKKRSSPKSEGFFWPKSRNLNGFSGQKQLLFPPKKISWGGKKQIGGQKRKSGGQCPPCPPAGDAPDFIYLILRCYRYSLGPLLCPVHLGCKTLFSNNSIIFFNLISIFFNPHNVKQSKNSAIRYLLFIF